MKATNYERYKRRIFEIIEASKENDFASKAYDTMMFLAVFVGMIPLCMKTENVYARVIDYVTITLFLIDYIIRLYTADYKMGYKSILSVLAYLITPMAIIDLLSITPILAIIFPTSVSLGLLRIFRVFQLLKLVRYSKTMTIIINTIKRVKGPLFAVFVISIIYILASAMVIFQVEPDLFKNFFEAVYWATISITTVGYGDIAPVTDIGRLVTILSSLVGVAVIALPTGIITAAYTDELKRRKNNNLEI